MKEPSPSAIVGGIAEHMLPFAAVGIELWRMLIQRFIESLGEMREADLRVMSGRPDRLDTRPNRDALYERVRDRSAGLRDDLRRAEDMPKGWFAWGPTAKRRVAAIDQAAAAEKEWSTAGSMKFLQAGAAKLERAVRRQDKRIQAFDARPEVQASARRLDDYPGAIRMLEGLAELAPDKELHAVLAPTVGKNGEILRVNAAAGLELLRRRVAIASAVRGAGAAGKGGRKDVPEMEVVPEVEPEMEDRPDTPDDDDSLGPVAGLLM